MSVRDVLQAPSIRTQESAPSQAPSGLSASEVAASRPTRDRSDWEGAGWGQGGSPGTASAFGLAVDVSAAARLLFRSRRFVVALTAAAMAAGLAVTYVAEPQYTAKAALFPSGDSDGLNQVPLGNFAGLASNLGLNLGAGSLSLAYPDIVDSRQVRERVLDRTFPTQKAGSVCLQDYLTSSEFKPLVRRAKGLRELRKRVRLSVDKLSGVIELRVTMPEAELAAAVATAFVEELIRVEEQVRTETAHHNREFIEQRLRETAVDLQDAENALKRFREGNLRIGNDPELLLEAERLERETRIQEQVYLTLTQQFELAKIEETRKGAGIQVIDPAKQPFSKSSPILLKNLVLGAFFGFVGASILVLAHAWWATMREQAALGA